MIVHSLILSILLTGPARSANLNDVVIMKGDTAIFDGVLVPERNYRDFVTNRAELDFMQSLKEHEENYECECQENGYNSVYAYLSIFAAGVILGSVYQK